MRAHLGADALASVVVFLVALPLCMGIAIASGMPAAAGLVTGILGGLIVGVLAGSPLQVSGPAAGLAVIVWQIVDELGVAALGAIVLLAGLIQVGAGLLRLGQWFRAVAPAVIRGMLAGIGVLIFASQFHVMLDDLPKGSGLQNLATIPRALYKGVFPMDGSVHHLAAAIGLVTVVTIVAWDAFKPKAVRAVPGPLLAVVVAAALAQAMALPIAYVDIPDSLGDSLTPISLDAFRAIELRSLGLEAVAMAFIASAETLLCATAVDQMHSGPRTRYDRELVAQGVGNTLCGLVGALPMTGVIVRSTANVNAGARTRTSAILHGAWLLVLVLAFPGLLELIPRAALAGILVYTGYKLVNPTTIRELRKFGRAEVAVYAATLATIVAVDLLTGVVVGVALSAGRNLLRFSRLGVAVEQKDGRYDVRLSGAATFLALPKLARAIEAIPEDAEVHIHTADLYAIDHACIDLLQAQERRYMEVGGKLVVEWDELLGRYHGH